MHKIDLRSDTVTKPSLAMRKAMAEAEVGDDVFSEDPTVQRLEAAVAELLGKEAAIYTPSGCMANQLALKLHTVEGDEVILEADSHIFNYETTAASYLSRIQLYPVRGVNRGVLTAAEVETAAREKAYYMPVTRLLALENTHNRAGGTVYREADLEPLAALARREGFAMHLDGARLWNACKATGTSPAQYAKYFDTVAVCFSKGLGAPVGSALAGPREMIAAARRHRKIWGGGMRQAGIIAAGALYAVEHNRDRIEEDHENARLFAQIISEGTTAVSVDLEAVETNIVLLRTRRGQNIERLLGGLEERGVRLSRGAGTAIRAVTHMDVTQQDCRRAAEIVVDYLNA